MKIEFSKEEREAVLPQLTTRLHDLKEMMADAGAQKNTIRVLELAQFIVNIENFTNRLLNAD